MSASGSQAGRRLAQLAGREWGVTQEECYGRLDPSSPSDYRVLATLLASEWSSDAPRCVGLAGGQGAGKTTLSRLVESACAYMGRSACVLSLDDFYYSRAHRAALAENVHPLLETRGPPGTHDVLRCREAIGRLRHPGAIELPIFDKGLDEPTGTRRVRGPFDLVLVEGWCVGARPEDDESLATSINRLERERDADGTWRRYVNAQLAGPYAQVWSELDYLVYLRVPDLVAVRRWRLQQESARPEDQRLDAAAVDDFVQHFERITHSMMDGQMQRADLIVELANDHGVASVAFCPD
jgi:D-glycerate 3-kinase